MSIELTPGSLQDEFPPGTKYIPDNQIIYVKYLGNGPLIKIRVIDMRVYDNPDRWLIDGELINQSDNKHFEGTSIHNNIYGDFQWPRDKFFTLNKMKSLAKLTYDECKKHNLTISCWHGHLDN